MHNSLLSRKKVYGLVVILIVICIGLTVYATATTRDKPVVSPVLPTPKVSERVDSAPVSIDPSMPKRIYIPSRDKDLAISTIVRPMPSKCRQVIDPPRTGPTVGDVFVCKDFDLPGNGSGVSVLAGHSSLHLTAWLNRLYKQGNALVGREIMIQTATSGDKWLVYRVGRVYTPSNEELPYMTDVWGAPGETVKERLIVVTCLQNDNGSASTRNYVVVAQLVGVR